MDLNDLYLGMQERLEKITKGMIVKHVRSGPDNPLSTALDDVAGSAHLAFMKAVASHRAGSMSLEDWVGLRLQNMLQDWKRNEAKRIKPWKLSGDEPIPARTTADVDLWLDLSEDAAEVAKLLLCYKGRGGCGVKAVRQEAYKLMNWRQFWNAIAELQAYLTTEPEVA